ncbi:ATP synthase subunit g: mitochondrial-like isoform X2 [Dinothrombium tinctorium]|uniref:ATP synthase subunit g n=1 Tax=Dinothrombium tinctorium TaxID=1965070 RepID=A0A3S3PI81_9ACAR|nr:ATP synthase subunit g: mitochondrial-like isoform X2 [Dinothrombium tinctorium]
MSKLVQRVIKEAPVWGQQALVYSKPRLAKFVEYAKVELTPPKPTDIPAIAKGFANIARAAKSGSYRNMSMREAWLNTLVTIEVLCWFFVGECIGKGSIVAYKV